MPEHQQIQQSTESKSTFQKQATPIIQTPISNPMAIIQRARINPKSLTHADVMQLQRTIGNRAVARLFSEIGLIPSTAKPVQKQEISEEEKTCPSCLQKQTIPEEDETLQGKFGSKAEQAICPSCCVASSVQRQESEEEEPLQGMMIETIQRQEIPEEEPLQGKMADTIQRQEIPEEEPLKTKNKNDTGMSDNLKAGVESLSGIDMSDVRVHYNSSKPAEIGALAYTQGTNIHVAPGQERHLPHETWHVVQQLQRRVRPIYQRKEGEAVNDDFGLGREADMMGEKVLQMRHSEKSAFEFSISTSRLPNVLQRKEYFKGEANPPKGKEVRYSQISVQNINATKRMQAMNLNYNNISGGSERSDFEDHSELYREIASLFKQNELHDMHLLHAQLGGQGKPPNLVPGPKNTNNNMFDFEQAVISMVTPAYGKFMVVDYEVAVNYGRSGNDLRATLPTSLDMRVTEKKTENEGVTWVDDENTFARNVAIQAPAIFGKEDASASPDNEQDIDQKNSVMRDESIFSSRNYNAKFGDTNWARTQISRNGDPATILYHFNDFGLITDRLKDSHFVWNPHQLAELINRKFGDLLDTAKKNLQRVTVPQHVKEKLWETVIQEWNKQVIKSAEISSGHMGLPTESLEDADFWLQRILESLEESWLEVENEYSEHVQQANTALKLAKCTPWSEAAKNTDLAIYYTNIAHDLIEKVLSVLLYYTEKEASQAKSALELLQLCTLEAQETRDNTVLIPEYIEKISTLCTSQFSVHM